MALGAGIRRLVSPSRQAAVICHAAHAEYSRRVLRLPGFARIRAPLLIYLACAALYVATLGARMRGPSDNVHFVSLAESYLHGSLLPKNPHLADLLLGRALGQRLAGLDDEVERAAHNWIRDRELAGSRR